MSNLDVCRFGILTASTELLRMYEDKVVQKLKISKSLTSPWKIYRLLTADNKEDIENGIIELIDKEMCNVVITTGGLDLPLEMSPQKQLNLFVSECYLVWRRSRISLEYASTAVLSRQTANKGECLVINLPGSLGDR